MKNYHIERQIKQIDEKILQNIICNRCGKEVDFSERENQAEDLTQEEVLAKNRKKTEMHEFQLEFDYTSQFEGQKWKFDLCESCLADFVGTFAVLPEGYGENTLDFAYPQINFDDLEEPTVKEDEEKE